MEYLDLVDENDNIIGRETRDYIYQHGLKNFRVINIMLFNSRGELLVPKRSSNRSMFPNCYDFSAGGHVDSGESYLGAAYRELKEELGIDGVYLEEVAYFAPNDIGTSSFSKLYKLNYDGPINYDRDCIESIEYFPLSELSDMVRNYPKLFKSDYPKMFKWYVDKYLK